MLPIRRRRFFNNNNSNNNDPFDCHRFYTTTSQPQARKRPLHVIRRVSSPVHAVFTNCVGSWILRCLLSTDRPTHCSSQATWSMPSDLSALLVTACHCSLSYLCALLAQADIGSDRLATELRRQFSPGSDFWTEHAYRVGSSTSDSNQVTLCVYRNWLLV